MSNFSLPDRYLEPLQVLAQQLAALTSLVEPLISAEVQALSSVEASVWLQASDAIATLQQFFAQEIQPLTEQDVSPEMRSRFRSAQTEMHRQLRLLPTDLMFLRSARQLQTQRQRQQQLKERLDSLRGYCAALLD